VNLKKPICIIASFLLLQQYLPAQDKSNVKFGKVTPADFDLSKSSFDTSAPAVVIADIGNTSFTGNGKGAFTLIFKRTKRIKILSKNGYNAATEEIPVYNDGADGENLTEVKASTFNLENGAVVETKLDPKSIFIDKIDKHSAIKKFTMPSVKEGSIIDISYTIKSDYIRYLRSWSFQGIYPCLWSEYEIKVPVFFHYIFMKQGNLNFYINTTKDIAEFYSVRESGGATLSDDIYNISSSAVDQRWVIKDMPVLKEEPFTSTIDNYEARIDFQLHFIQYSETGERHDIMGSYFIASKNLLKDENFGGALDDDNGWMNNELNAITKGSTTQLEKMQKIYSYLRDNFTCTKHHGIYTDNSLKSVFKSKSGNLAEINLLLVGMLRHLGLEADPAILSTRSNGFASELYPLMARFNYVICVAKDNGTSYTLDASWPKLSFGKLDNFCYNGGAREINSEHPVLINLSPDSLKEAKLTTVFLINKETGGPDLDGTFSSVLGNTESYNLRENVSEKSVPEYFKNLKSNNADYNIANSGIDSLSQLDMPATVHYDFTYKIPSEDDIIYFSPMFSEGYKDNPFKSADRKYPVEMSYVKDETYVLNMEIPKGYMVDEIPKSARVSLNGDEGSFEYMIAKDETNVQLRTRLKLNKATFTPEDYNTLRDFFSFVVKKQSEQVVFKKKK
jgi:Domain of Unknown Function with PDB structure (DUF3858)/Transglutaminase-like superfamily